MISENTLKIIQVVLFEEKKFYNYNLSAARKKDVWGRLSCVLLVAVTECSQAVCGYNAVLSI